MEGAAAANAPRPAEPVIDAAAVRMELPAAPAAWTAAELVLGVKAVESCAKTLSALQLGRPAAVLAGSRESGDDDPSAPEAAAVSAEVNPSPPAPVVAKLSCGCSWGAAAGLDLVRERGATRRAAAAAEGDHVEDCETETGAELEADGACAAALRARLAPVTLTGRTVDMARWRPTIGGEQGRT